MEPTGDRESVVPERLEDPVLGLRDLQPRIETSPIRSFMASSVGARHHPLDRMLSRKRPGGPMFFTHHEPTGRGNGFPGRARYNADRTQRSSPGSPAPDSPRRLVGLGGGTMSDASGSSPARPDPNETLVKVFDSEHESEAMVVKGLLDSVGIDADLTSIEAFQDTLPGVGGTIIRVRAHDAAEARRIIEEARQSPLEDDDPTDAG